MTKIEWVRNADKSQGKTWNVVTGCSHAGGPGCDMCYARRMARRLAGRCGYPEYPHHFDVTLHPDRLDIPLRRRKPTTYFICSMSDPFHADVPFGFIDKVMTTIAACNGLHVFQLLTKRPKRMLEYFNTKQYFASEQYKNRPLRNLWLGISCENQATADERIPLLLQTPAAVRFVSCEPLLGPIDLESYLSVYDQHNEPSGPRCNPDGTSMLSWCVVGGESGPGARPMHPGWARSLRDQCQEAGIPYFHKQNGEYIPADGYNQWGTSLDGKLVDPAKVRGVYVVPGDIYSGVHMVRVGKKWAGRLLDGREWNEMPNATD